MADNLTQTDAISDDLISILIDPDQPNSEREKATRSLYQRHESWVIQQVRKRIHNPDDVQDVTQNVWMMVLNPDNLASKYTAREGKFRAYLRNPINWCVLKHIDKLPFTVNETGEKQSPIFVDIDDQVVDEGLDECLLEETIENIIKPSLPSIPIKHRNVYVATQYRSIFKQQPVLKEVADINALTDSRASELLASATGRAPAECDDHEISVHLPINYRSLIDPTELKKSNNRYLAKIMGITDAAFRKRLHTARSQLLELLRNHLDNPGV